MNWIYKNKTITKPIDDYIGFVYQITNTTNDMKYIGKKLFWSTRKLPPLKGKKRKRTKIIESNWQDYYGSSDNLNEEIKLIGKDSYKREILFLAVNKSILSYMEAKLQFDNDVLLRDDYYNGIISCRINHRGLSSLKLT